MFDNQPKIRIVPILQDCERSELKKTRGKSSVFCEMGRVLVKVVKVNCCLGELCQIKTETKGAKLYRGQKMNETFRVIFKHCGR